METLHSLLNSTTATSSSTSSPSACSLQPPQPQGSIDPSTSKHKELTKIEAADHVGAPMLAEIAKSYEFLDEMISSTKLVDGLTDEAFIYEEKYDGERTICRVTMETTDPTNDDEMPNGFVCEYYSRNLHSFGKRVPPICVRLRHPYVSAVLDGERVYVKDGQPQVVPIGCTGPRSLGKYTQRYVVFDVQSVNGESVTSLTWTLRRQLLSHLLVETEDVVCISSSPFTTTSDLRLTLNAVLARGGEGLILKKCSGHYYCGERREEWLKLKPISLVEHRMELDLYVRRAFRNKAGEYVRLECGYYNTTNHDEYSDKTFVRVCRTPWGMSDEDRSRIASLVDPKTHIVADGRVVVVLSAEKPQAGSRSLRYPRFIRFAFEKKVVDVHELFE